MFHLRPLPAQVDGLGLGALELRLRLGDVGFRHDAGPILVLGQAQRACVSRDGLVEQALMFVDHP